MSIPLIVNGVTFNYPQQGDINWAPTLTNWSSAVTNALQVTSNNFTLLTNHSIIFKDSEGTPKSLTLGIPSPLTATWALTLPVNAGSVGQVLSTNGSGVTSWINAAGGGTINNGTTGQLAYYASNGSTLSGETMSGDATIAVGGVLTIVSSAITNAKIIASAGISLSKLATLTASRIVVSDSSGFLTTTATPTLTELSYLSGVTSAIQTQINNITTAQGNYLPLAGGTMSGAISMASHKITSLSNGTNNGDSVNFSQLPQLSTPYARGIKVSWLNTNQNHLLWSDAVLEDTSGNKVRNTNAGAIVSMFITNSGVNGLDTGSVAANTFYYIWLISDGTNFNGLYSASQTSPTMPGSYTYKILAGCVLTDGSANIIRTMQVGQYVEYISTNNIISDSTHNGTVVVGTLGAFVPPVLAWRIFLFTGLSANYSDANNHSIQLNIGSLQGGSPTPPQVWGLTGKTPVNGTYTGWMNTINELPAGCQFNYAAAYDATNLTAFTTNIFVSGYQLTALSIT